MCISFVTTTKEQLKQSFQVDAIDKEWKTKGWQDNRPFAVAGIYRQWSEIEQEDSYAFICIYMD